MGGAQHVRNHGGRGFELLAPPRLRLLELFLPVSLSQAEAVRPPLFRTSFKDDSIEWQRQLEKKSHGEPFSLQLKSGKGSTLLVSSPEETTGLVKKTQQVGATAAIILHKLI